MNLVYIIHACDAPYIHSVWATKEEAEIACHRANREYNTHQPIFKITTAQIKELI